MTLQINYESLQKSTLIKIGILSTHLGITFDEAASLLLSTVSKKDLEKEAA